MDEINIATIRELLDFTVRHHKERTAVKFLNRENDIVEKTYVDLKNDATKVSKYITTKNTGNEKIHHIAILGDISYEWLVTYYGIMNAGAVAVPLNKELSATELVAQFKFADISMVFFDKSLNAVIDSLMEDQLKKEQFVSLKSNNSFLSIPDILSEAYNGVNLLKPQPGDLATIMFTSGTTGQSKGVMLSHQNICENMRYCKTIMHDSPERLATVPILPMHHMFEITCGILAPVYEGYPICIGNGIKYLIPSMQLFKPTILTVVPTVIEMFHKQIWLLAAQKNQAQELKEQIIACENLLSTGVDKRNQQFASIRELFGGKLTTIICGGAPLDPELEREFYLFGISVLNGYGITECAPVISCNRYTRIRNGSVGVNDDKFCQMKIIDNEICVTGGNVMMGYYKDEQTTAMVISNGYFRTGDLGYIDEDGFIFITGRKKNLIILENGENVSPEELETRYGRIPLVSEILVHLKKHRNRMHIAARVVPNLEYAQKNNISNIAKVLENEFERIDLELPIFKRIHFIEVVEEGFEKTALGKIKRHLYVLPDGSIV
jgi:long-chain acyl-CoA synthetase